MDNQSDGYREIRKTRFESKTSKGLQRKSFIIFDLSPRREFTSESKTRKLSDDMYVISSFF